MIKAVFSPTGGTRRIADAVAPSARFVDLCAPVSACTVEEALLVVLPVFAGRVPEVALERLQMLTPRPGTPAVAVVVYGNRAYEDALAELHAALSQQGYLVLAAAAFVAEHSVIRSIAAGRPNAEDKAAAAAFGRAVMERLALPAEEWQPVAVPGNPAPGERKKMPATPLVGEACGFCGCCAAVCPVGAIPADAPDTTDASHCILCMRCVAECPTGARHLPPPMVAMMTARLNAVAAEPKAPDLFL